VIQRHGWILFALPPFLNQLENPTAAAERARQADPKNWRGNASVKLLAALMAMVLERIPRDPLAPEFRQGNMLGPADRHWFRAKFGANCFRLFYRAESASRIVVYVWVNDRATLRKAGASRDPYAVFARMLKRGNPPDDWSSMLTEAQAEAARFTSAVSDPEKPG
jgi:toxin YhaV